MVYATAALDSGQHIRDYVQISTKNAIPVLGRMLSDAVMEAAPGRKKGGRTKQEKIGKRIEECSKTTVYQYIVDAVAVLFNEEPYIKTLVSKKQTAVIMTHL